jgi:glycine betaine/proline transport system ATP-binding protein
VSTAVEFKHVDILFSGEGRDGRRAQRDALAALDAGKSRSDIQTQYGVIVGVADANLTVERGEISVLMGLSGSGKSTLMRAANGLNRVTRGSVLIGDGASAIDVASCDAKQMRGLRRERVAMVFQQFGLLPWRTVRDNVGFGLELRGEPVARRNSIVSEKLELVGLSQWANRYVSELSGGMQQRVGLARAFATDADILLMDEPFSALDPLIRGKLQDELLELQSRVKKTILFVSHDMDEALRLGDRISIMQNGRIIQTGTADDIVLAPADEYVAEFVRHMNPMTVLTGSMIMKRRAHLQSDGSAVWLDAARRYRLSLDDLDRATDLTIDGSPHTLNHIRDEADVEQAQEGLSVVPASVALQAIIRLRQRTGHPVLVSDEGRILGVCCESDIIRALAGEPAAPDAAVVDLSR